MLLIPWQKIATKPIVLDNPLTPLGTCGKKGTVQLQKEIASQYQITRRKAFYRWCCGEYFDMPTGHHTETDPTGSQISPHAFLTWPSVFCCISLPTHYTVGSRQ